MTTKRTPISTGTLVSLGLHAMAALALLGLTAHRVVSRPLHLPGTAQGLHLLLSYSLGAASASPQASLPHPRSVSRAVPPPVRPLPSPTRPSPETAATTPGDKGTGTTGDSALGDENIRVALPQVHPRPQPDLSSLPPGAAGDVVVDVVIDDGGRIASTTLVKGLGAPIDTAVMQVLHGWVFTPATRDGKNIASEQEILIHYQRG